MGQPATGAGAHGGLILQTPAGEMQEEMTPDERRVNEIFDALPKDLQEEIKRELEEGGAREKLRKLKEQRRAQQEAVRREAIERQEEDRAAGRKMIADLELEGELRCRRAGSGWRRNWQVLCARFFRNRRG